jgi:hypothetical protein
LRGGDQTSGSDRDNPRSQVHLHLSFLNTVGSENV